MASMLSRRCSTILLALAVPMLAHAAASPGAVSNQVSVAGIHADMALDATELSTAQLHLHHVINCLEGPDGKDFDAKATNPCHDMGQGAIVDAKDDSRVDAKLNEALQHAKSGLKAKTLKDVHADAQQVFNLLQSS